MGRCIFIGVQGEDNEGGGLFTKFIYKGKDGLRASLLLLRSAFIGLMHKEDVSVQDELKKEKLIMCFCGV